MSKRNYIRWDTKGVEKIPPNETEDIQAVADMINCMQKAQWDNHRHCYTGQPNSILSVCIMSNTSKARTPEHRDWSKANWSFPMICPIT